MARQLGVYAEILWLDKPLERRISRLTEMGFGVGLWNWPDPAVEWILEQDS